MSLGDCLFKRRLSHWNIFNVASCEELDCQQFEGFPEEVFFSDDILGKVAHIVEGFLGVVILSIVNVEEDGIIVIVGVEGVKGMFFLRFL